MKSEMEFNLIFKIRRFRITPDSNRENFPLNPIKYLTNWGCKQNENFSHDWKLNGITCASSNFQSLSQVKPTEWNVRLKFSDS